MVETKFGSAATLLGLPAARLGFATVLAIALVACGAKQTELSVIAKEPTAQESSSDRFDPDGSDLGGETRRNGAGTRRNAGE